MKKVFILGIFTLLIGGCAHFENRGAILTEFLAKKDCNGAENYVKNMAADNEGQRYFFRGAVHLECRKNRKSAVEYFKLGAQNGDQNSIDILIKMGEKVPEQPKIVYRDRVISPPPPAQPQQIIIQQQPMMNPNACIQDGGGVFCPNHPSTQSTTPLFRPVFK